MVPASAEFGVDLMVQPYAPSLSVTARLDAWYHRSGFADGAEAGRLTYEAGSRHVPSPR